MRKFFFLILLGLMSFTSKAQTTLFFNDFQTIEGFEKDFFTYELDANTLTPFMKSIGFDVNKPWWFLKDKAESTNQYIGSTSNYDPAGQANDWMVTRAIAIPSKGCELTWKSQSFDRKKRDGLWVYISTVSQYGMTEDMLAFKVDEEDTGPTEDTDNEWTEHSVNLDKYEGQTIYIAFVNKSNDKMLLFIDDVWVGRNDNYAMTVDVEKYVNGVNDLEIKGTVSPIAEQALTEYTAYYSYEGKTHSKKYSGLNVQKGGKHSFVFDEKMTLVTGKTTNYKVWITVGTEPSLEESSTVSCMAFVPKRKIVIEEGTGTWCGFCPLGMVSFEHLKKNYPDDFIGIAVHNQDAMTVTEYDRGLGFSQFPLGVVNRKYLAGPMESKGGVYTHEGGFETYFLQAREELTLASVELQAGFTDETKTKIAAKVTTKSALDMPNANYSIALVVLENNVSGYKQKNYLNTVVGQDLGGFEKGGIYGKAEININFNDVARSILDAFRGIRNSVPTSLNIATPAVYERIFDVPTTVANKDEMELVALLLDNATGEIVNAAKANDLNNVGIKETNSNSFSSVVYQNENQLIVDVKTVTEEPTSIDLFSIDGKKLQSTPVVNVNGTYQFALPTNGLKGIYLVKLTSGKEILIKKVTLK